MKHTKKMEATIQKFKQSKLLAPATVLMIIEAIECFSERNCFKGDKESIPALGDYGIDCLEGFAIDGRKCEAEILTDPDTFCEWWMEAWRDAEDEKNCHKFDCWREQEI
jgi:hypothetical protein